MFNCKLNENYSETKQNAVDHIIDVTRDFSIVSSSSSSQQSSITSSISADLSSTNYIFTSESLNEKEFLFNSLTNNCENYSFQQQMNLQVIL